MAEEKQVVIEGMNGNRLADRINRPMINKVFGIVFVILAFTIMWVNFCKVAMTNLNSDGSVPINLAAEIIRTHNPFPAEWNYGGDIWVLSSHWFVALFASISGNYLVSFAIGMIIISVLQFLSCVFFSRKVFKNISFVILFPFLVLGTTYEFFEILFTGHAYCSLIIFILLSIGLFAAAFNKDMTVASRPALICLCLLIAYMNLEGVRYLQAVSVPMLGTIVILFFIENHNKDLQVKTFSKYFSALIKLAVFALIGFIGFTVLKNVTNFSEGASTVSFKAANTLFGNVENLYDTTVNLLGIKEGVKLFSADGILMAVQILFSILMIFVFPVMQIRNFKNESFEMRFFIIFTLLHIAEVVFLFLFTSMGTFYGEVNSRYFFSSLILLMAMSSNYIFKKFLNNEHMICFVPALLCCVLAVVPGAARLCSQIENYHGVNETQKSILTYLEEHNLSYGYATYWNSGVFSALSNRAVQVNAINISDKIIRYEWLNSSYAYCDEAYQGSTFLLFDENENKQFLESAYQTLQTPVQVDNVSGYVIYVYDHNISQNNFSRAKLDVPYSEQMQLINCDINEEDLYQTNGTEGYCMFGPYAPTMTGNYRFTLHYKVKSCADGEKAGIFDAAINSGSAILGSADIPAGSESVSIDVSFSEGDTFEYRVWNYPGSVIEIDSVEMEKLN